ncbi:hypothetical protein KQX54_016117 [Cotesia glomerata]|uniref:Fatty acyl-CoA reductase n=1 Tax=Cotesia glomerata TaxID=32391 RepID=A0AAV7HUK5_COTGL|nr:hypothetical protein KQX54_016117 [Cotesia glomerata]
MILENQVPGYGNKEINVYENDININENNNNILNRINTEQVITRTPIQDFYAGRNIFITGASGFLGKTMIEKLLRICPEVSTIYILMRPKKKSNIIDRIEDIFNEPIFEDLKNNSPKLRHKIVAIPGDCSFPDLGLTLEDRKKIIEEVSVVFHNAATVKFEEKLKVATTINAGGTLSVINLCKEIKNLKAMIHVSTAYANCHLDTIDEQFYPHPLKYEDLRIIVDSLPDETINAVLPRLLEKWPNTYTYTKALAESVIREKSQDLPIGIFRPSITMYLVSGIITVVYQIVLTFGLFALNILAKAILFFCAIIYTVCQPIGFVIRSESSIFNPTETMYPEYAIEENLLMEEAMSAVSLTSTDSSVTEEIRTSQNSLTDSSEVKRESVKKILKERVVSCADDSLPGWIDNYYGPTGVIAAAAVGFLRSIRINRDIYANMVPVDYTVNAILASAWDVATHPDRRRENMLIYNYTSTVENPITWGFYIDNCLAFARDYPLKQSIWYLTMTTNQSKVINFLANIILHLLPALLADILMVCRGHKPHVVKSVTKINRFLNVIQPFMLKNWSFKNDNVQRLWSRLDSKDKLSLRFTFDDFDWKNYLRNHMKGVRLFLFKEDPNSLESARKRLRSLRWIHETATHGLWPAAINGRVPKNCNDPKRKSKLNSNHFKGRPDDLYNALTSLWFNIVNDLDAKRGIENFWMKKWDHHGACASQAQSIRDDVGYFSRAIKMMKDIYLAIKVQ